MLRSLTALVIASALAGSGLAQIQLGQNVPVTVSPTAFQTPIVFSPFPAPGGYSAIGLASAGNYSLTHVANSDNPGSATEFVIASAGLAANSSNSQCTALGSGASPPLPAVLEHVTAQSLPLNVLVSTSVAAGHVLKVLSVASTGSGPFELLVTGDPSLRWYLFNAGFFDSWRPRSSRLMEGQVGGVGVPLNPFTGYALVVAREGGVSSVDLPFTVRLASTSTHLTLPGPGTSSGNFTAGNYQFTSTPQVNRWNAVGAFGFGPGTGVYTIHMGSVTQNVISGMGYVLANGRLGPIVPADGLLAFSSTFNLVGSIHQAGIQTFSVGSPGTRNWSTNDLIHIFEFEILTAAHYDLSVTGPSSLGWSVFTPGISPNWRPRSAALTSDFVGTPRNLVQLAPGWHAIVVFRPLSAAVSGAVTCSVGVSPNFPVPVLTSLSPASAPAGGTGFTLTANGSLFVSGGSEIRWNGTALTTTFVNSGQLTAAVPAALIAAGGTVIVTVFTGAPGGGTSSGEVFTINNPAPVLTSLSPDTTIAGGPGFTMTLNGSGYVAGTTAFWNGTNLSTTVGAATQLTASVPASLIAAPGSSLIRVFTPGPGGGLSAGLSFTTRAPSVAQLLTTTIPVLTAGSAPIDILITGADFLPTAQAYADSTALPTVVFGSTLLQASVGPAVPGALRRGGLAIAVENGHLAPSNALALPVGGGSNKGTIVRHPLDPAPGETYAAMLEDGFPLAPLIIIADVLNPAPLYPFPTASTDFVLSVRPAAIGQPDWFLLTDSIGLFGGPFGPSYDAAGRLFLPGFVAPNPPLGISLTIQGAFVDPTVPAGFRIIWPRFPDEL